MSNKKISDLATVGYKATLMLAGIDPSLAPGQQNIKLAASSIADAAGGASSIDDLTDAADLTGSPNAFVGFDEHGDPAAIIAPAASSFVGYDESAAPVTLTRAQMLAALGLTNATITAYLQSVSNSIITLMQKLPGGFTIASLDSSAAAGSFTVAIAINGTAVGGLGAVAVASPSNVNTLATGANTGAQGDTITATISAAAGAVSAVISLNLVRT